VIPCLFATDLHGRLDRYRKLFRAIEAEKPTAVFLGGDLLPGMVAAMAGGRPSHDDFVNDYLAVEFELLKSKLAADYPEVFVILGNDDGRMPESAMHDVSARGLWTYLHDRSASLGSFTVYGYAYVPPTPFLLKDWERYDVSRYVDPGCISPEDGRHSVPVPRRETKLATIQDDIERLTGSVEMERAVFLFHSPPYRTKLDRAALDGKMIDHVPLDVHVGSIAIQRFIKSRQPWLSMHGHIHESVRLTGTWLDRIDKTVMLGAAHDGPELALIGFDLTRPSAASRRLL